MNLKSSKAFCLALIFKQEIVMKFSSFKDSVFLKLSVLLLVFSFVGPVSAQSKSTNAVNDSELVVLYTYSDKMPNSNVNPVAQPLMVYSKTSDGYSVKRYGSKTKHKAEDPFLWEIFSLDSKTRNGYFGRGIGLDHHQYAYKHIFIPSSLEVGSVEIQQSYSQGTNKNLNGKFSSEIVKAEGDILYIKHRFPHQDAGQWDRDIVLKMLPNGGFIFLRDEFKVYNRSEIFHHTVWEIKIK